MTFSDGLPDHLAAYVLKVLPKGLHTSSDLMRPMSRCMTDVVAGTISTRDADIINRQTGRLLREAEKRLKHLG